MKIWIKHPKSERILEMSSDYKPVKIWDSLFNMQKEVWEVEILLLETK